MKKFVASIASAGLLAAGLVAFGGASATAAPTYAPTVTTDVVVEKVKPVKAGQKLRLKLNIATAGTAAPKGKLKLVYKRKNAAGKWVALTKAQKKTLKRSIKFNGKAKKVTLGRPKVAGKYRATVVFKPKAGTVFKKSKSTVKFKVKRR